jgi:gamma-glutamylcyclotransferase (GGCT)/AIG2-like uncharacterized protein YtfP
MPAQVYSVEERLIVYGSLAQGAANAHILAPYEGVWLRGSVTGELESAGWGSVQGYPGIRLIPSAPRIAVWVFCSKHLPSLWTDLDRFEGPDYRRTITEVTIEEADVQAQIYELAAR